MIWRDPDEETLDLYPGLVVHDGRQRGSITIGRTRLPLWAITHTAILDRWAEVEADYQPDGFTDRHFANFVHDIVQLRGEFARLILVLANTERVDRDTDEDDWPTAWWEHPERTAPVVEQLRRCLDTLTREDP